jgi:hypothetical protein
MRPTSHARRLGVLVASALLAGAALGAGAVLLEERELADGHRVFDTWLGTWRAEVTVQVPGGGEASYAGSETNRLGPGGRWMLSDLRFQLLDGSYESHAALGYDPDGDSWVASWVDTTDDVVKVGDGRWNETTREFRWERRFRDTEGEVIEKIVDRFVDSNTREVVVHEVVHEAAGGDEPVEAMRIVLRRN